MEYNATCFWANQYIIDKTANLCRCWKRSLANSVEVGNLCRHLVTPPEAYNLLEGLQNFLESLQAPCRSSRADQRSTTSLGSATYSEVCKHLQRCATSSQVLQVYKIFTEICHLLRGLQNFCKDLQPTQTSAKPHQ